MSDLVLSGPEDGHVVVDDGVLRSGRTQLQHDSSFFGASKLGLVNIIPAITFVILKQIDKFRFNYSEDIVAAQWFSTSFLWRNL